MYPKSWFAIRPDNSSTYVATIGRFIGEYAGNPDQLLEQVLGLPGIEATTDPFAPLDALYTRIITGSSKSHRTLTILWLNLIYRERLLDQYLMQDKMHPQSPSASFVRSFLGSYQGEASVIFSAPWFLYRPCPITIRRMCCTTNR
jgi:hypothetical protein